MLFPMLFIGNIFFCNYVHTYISYIFSYTEYMLSSQLKMYHKIYTAFINVYDDKKFFLDAHNSKAQYCISTMPLKY